MTTNYNKNPDLQIEDWPKPKKRDGWVKSWSNFERKGVLFDLDGTLLDTAGDLGAAANILRSSADLPPMPIEKLRPHTSRGARGMIEVALGVKWNEPDYEELRKKFLKEYEMCLFKTTKFMPNMDQLLLNLEKNKILWGIVTNKHEKYTMPIVEGLKLNKRYSTLVCGDTLEFCKPHPAPVKYAIENLQLSPKSVVYIGDDPRDIQSGFNAGCWTIGVAFDSFIKKSKAYTWGSDATVSSADEISALLMI